MRALLTSDNDGQVRIEHKHGHVPQTVSLAGDGCRPLVADINATFFTVTLFGRNQKRLKNTAVALTWQVEPSPS